MTVNSGNGWMKFSLNGQTLKWNTGVANVFTSDPYGLEGETLTAATVVEGDTVGDGYDTTYWTYGEGPVECVLCTDDDSVIYNGTPFFRAEGGLVEVHPTQAQIESGAIGDGVDHADFLTAGGLVTVEDPPWVTAPVVPTEITGEQGTDDTAILVAVLGALDDLGLITDSTTGA